MSSNIDRKKETSKIKQPYIIVTCKCTSIIDSVLVAKALTKPILTELIRYVNCGNVLKLTTAVPILTLCKCTVVNPNQLSMFNE